MSQKILRALPELLEAGVISQDTADRIRGYYQQKEGQQPNLLFSIFGILGALLVGLGIFLLIAHNWDELSRATKTIIAFAPMVLGQAVAAYTLLRRSESVAWREASATFLILAIGVCIALISQIYQIPGKISSFLLSWILLGLPLVYVLRSSMAGVLYLIGITYYACEIGYFTHPESESPIYWGLLLLLAPHYYFLLKKSPNGNFFLAFNWLVPISVLIVLGVLAQDEGPLMFLAYFSLLGLFYLVGHTPYFQRLKTIFNGYEIIGSLGMIILLLVASFDWFWIEMGRQPSLFESLHAPESWIALALTLACGALLFFNKEKPTWTDGQLKLWTPLIFAVIFLIGFTNTTLPVILTNLLLFALGISTIWHGTKANHLGILNYGLLIMTALIVSRFLDDRFSFVIRGLAFVALGIGFFVANYWMLRRRKTE
jgi:uncharacterized membrane protein